jgi:putative lipoprotein
VRPLLVLPALVLGLLAAACGGDDSSETDHLEGPVWELRELVGTPLPDAAAPTLQLTDGTAAGLAGCNNFTGGYALDGDALSLGPLATTRMACAPPLDAVESAYVAALESVASYSIDGNELVMRSADDTPVLYFEVPVGAL